MLAASRRVTHLGIVLVALNPYQSVPIYGLDVIKQYANHETTVTRPERAYCCPSFTCLTDPA